MNLDLQKISDPEEQLAILVNLKEDPSATIASLHKQTVKFRRSIPTISEIKESDNSLENSLHAQLELAEVMNTIAEIAVEQDVLINKDSYFEILRYAVVTNTLCLKLKCFLARTNNLQGNNPANRNYFQESKAHSAEIERLTGLLLEVDLNNWEPFMINSFRSDYIEAIMTLNHFQFCIIGVFRDIEGAWDPISFPNFIAFCNKFDYQRLLSKSLKKLEKFISRMEA